MLPPIGAHYNRALDRGREGGVETGLSGKVVMVSGASKGMYITGVTIAIDGGMTHTIRPGEPREPRA